MKTLFTSLLIILGNFCSNAQEPNQEIPPELGKKPFTLLVITPEKKAPARWLEDALEKYYKGEYIFIENNEQYSAKYFLKDKYPYVLMVVEGSIPGQFSAGGREAPSSSFSCGIRELKTAKVYLCDSGKANYKSMINEYISAIEKLRKTNSGE